jgi:flagellin-like protein
MFDTNGRERGQVGIGTLIVFIAMVLVAAIAAGVLVDTAGFLQSKSQQTGEDSTDSVTNRLEVVDTYGVVEKVSQDTDGTSKGTTYYATGSGTTGIYKLNFVVMRSAGSGDINLDQVVLMAQGPNGANQTSLSSAKMLSITAIEGASGNVLGEQKDRARITLTLDPYEDSGGAKRTAAYDYLTSGEEMTVKFTTTSGATVRKTVSVPSTLPSTGGSVIDL